ncbi:MmyB family transcriptional regulator [Nonomuraea muscovyensis]
MRRPAHRRVRPRAGRHRRGAVHGPDAGPARPARRTGVERWNHPAAGELRLAFETLELPDADEQRLLVHLPADEAASAALDQLTGRHPGALREVAG